MSAYRDRVGNVVHHFDVPGQHNRLRITAEARVECLAPAPIPEALPLQSWDELDSSAADGELWDYLTPSTFAKPGEALRKLAAELGVERRSDPLTFLKELNEGIFSAFDYRQQTTQVDSPIDDALEERQGVCQDFAHIMLALIRPVGIPARYVSGYLYHGADHHDRSESSASHAWIEAWLPGLQWVGFDPTNNLITGERHVKAAVGRDYADVPPTRGVFKGRATSELSVAVQVSLNDAPPPELEMVPSIAWVPEEPDDDDALHQQQQQQQQ